MIRRTGAGEAGEYLTWYRLIEAEAVSRRDSQVRRLTSFLEVEYVPSETPGGIERTESLILGACARVSAALDFVDGPATRVAFLSEATNAPWGVHPFGYCTDMYPYEKICIPSYLLSDPGQLAETVSHEYAHVVTLNVGKGRASRWLEECVSMQFESEADEEALAAFVSGDAPWKPPGELDQAFGSEDEDEVWDAYQQSLWIGRFLRVSGGDKGMARMLAAIGEDHAVRGTVARILGFTGDELGLRQTFGKGTSTTFRAALSWVRDRRPFDPGPFPS